MGIFKTTFRVHCTCGQELQHTSYQDDGYYGVDVSPCPICQTNIPIKKDSKSAIDKFINHMAKQKVRGKYQLEAMMEIRDRLDGLEKGK